MPALSARRMDDDRYVAAGLREGVLDPFCQLRAPYSCMGPAGQRRFERLRRFRFRSRGESIAYLYGKRGRARAFHVNDGACR